MNFSEAMKALKDGEKVTRQIWRDKVYFKLEEEALNSYQPILSDYMYTEEIMVSDGWLVDGNVSPMPFYEIIPFLRSGAHAKLEHWKNSHIYLDDYTKTLILKTMTILQFIPDFNAFAAEDWEVFA